MEEPKQPEAISVQDVSSSPAPNDGYLWKQTRTRRLFSAGQLFAFTLVYFITWFRVGGGVYFALLNGGPGVWLFSYFLVAPGVFCQVASFAEIASLMPVAGAQYYWTYHYAPPSMKLYLTWFQGWSTWAGYVAQLVLLVNAGALCLEGVIAINNEYEMAAWRTTIIILATLLLIMVINMWAFQLVPYFEFIAGILNFVLFLVVLVLLWTLGPRNSFDIFMDKTVYSGWHEHYFISFNIGSLSNIFLFVAFETMIHMGEETRNPKMAVPRALFWGVLVNMVLGLIMILTFGITMPSVELLLESVSPVVTMIQYATSSDAATTGIISGVFFLSFALCIGFLSSVSRLTWAWARDGGLPAYFAMVDGKTRVPMRAIVGTTFLGSCLALLNLSGEAYVAFAAISALAAIATYTSYAIMLACIIYARFATPGGLVLGEWNWGKAGIWYNVLGLIYTLYELVFLPFPNELPVTALNMNWSGPIYVGLIAMITAWWYTSARHTWKGPNMKIVEIVLRNDEASK